MSEELNTPEAVPGVADVSTAEGSGAEASVSLKELSSILGKEFADPQTALKSVKDTYNYVGGQATFREKISSLSEKLGTDENGVLAALDSLAGQNVPKKEEPKQSPAGDYVPRSQYEQDRFFAGNQNLEGLKDILVPLKNSQPNVSWQDFIAQPHVAQLVETNKTVSELQSKKSVLESNPRIGAASDKMNDARRAIKEGDINSARSNAVGAVMDVFKE